MGQHDCMWSSSAKRVPKQHFSAGFLLLWKRGWLLPFAGGMGYGASHFGLELNAKTIKCPAKGAVRGGPSYARSRLAYRATSLVQANLPDRERHCHADDRAVGRVFPAPQPLLRAGVLRHDLADG